MNIPCPACPDGYVWTREGQTGKACPVCKGTAYLFEDEDVEEEDEEESEEE